MPLIQRGHTFRWGHALPMSLQRRLNCGGNLGKSLSTRDRGLAQAFANYMSETAKGGSNMRLTTPPTSVGSER